MSGAGAAWSRPFFLEPPFFSGTGADVRADPIRSEPESAPGPWASAAGAGAAQKNGGSATLIWIHNTCCINGFYCSCPPHLQGVDLDHLAELSQRLIAQLGLFVTRRDQEI